MSQSLAKTIVNGTIWSAIDRFGVMGLQLLTYLILAHILSPDDFGAIGMLAIFIALAQNFVDGGFNSALVQKKEPTPIDYSTIFFWNGAFGSFLCLLLFIAAPFVAQFYKMPVLCNALRIMSISIIFCGLVSVQNAKLQKALLFRTLAFTNISTNLCAGALAILVACHGGGIWALVTLMMTQTIGKFIILFLVTHWVPKLQFSLSVFKQLFSFGGFIFIGTFMETVTNNIQGMIIGRKFSAAQTGYYTQASKMENIIGNSIPQIISTVMFPLFSKFQNDKAHLKSLIATNLRVISFAVYPLLTALIIFAPEAIQLLFGANWLPSAPYYRILCVGAFFFCLNNVNYFAVAAVGKSKALFHGALYRFAILGILIAVGIQFGMIGLMWSLALNMANTFLTNAFLCRRYIGQAFKAQFRAIFPSFGICAIAATITLIAQSFSLLLWWMNAILFFLVYLVAARIINIKAIKDSQIIFSKLLNKNK